MTFKIPYDAEYIINILTRNGYKAYIVGGCVRDIIRGVDPDDYDIATNALPAEIKDLFCDKHKIITIGARFGTVGIIIHGIKYEVTTFRNESGYSDNRRPDKVEFISDLYTDLSRRDFTINAMAYNHDDGLIDYFGGIDDIKNNIIRTVGDPYTRFNEDALRILRAIRFANAFNYRIDEVTEQAIFASFKLLDNIAVERISAELIKLLISTKCFGVLSRYFDEKIPACIDETDNYFVRLAMLTNTLRNKLCIDKKTDKIISLIKNLALCENNKIGIKKTLYNHGTNCEFFLLSCEYYYLLTHDEVFVNKKQLCNNILIKNECHSLKQLQISGDDIINLGITDGLTIKKIIGVLLDKVITESLPNNRAELLNYCKLFLM
jgi:tRNA nucleotidyltransferase (CCA-adding enzyme)